MGVCDLVKYEAKVKGTETVFASTPEDGIEFVFEEGTAAGLNFWLF